MNNYREVIIHSKPTEFETINLSHGGTFTTDNAQYICNLTTKKSDEDVIAYAKAKCADKGLELGTINEVTTKQGGFYAGAKEFKKAIHDWK